MQFTYDAYRELIRLIESNDYQFCSYLNWAESRKCVILRHDIDYDIEKAVKIALVESDLGISSTFFALVSSDFYNVYSAYSNKMLRMIKNCGHDIGLHFDETRYPGISLEEIPKMIRLEADMLSSAIGDSIEYVSMHRPSKDVLEANLSIPEIVNTYGQTFFKEFKYLSDSRRRWREPVEDVISSGVYDRLHILTHAFWYNDTEKDIYESVKSFVNRANLDRYHFMKDNITDIIDIMAEEEVR